MVETSLMPLVIGNYLLNSTTEILILQNIADIIVAKHAFKSFGKVCMNKDGEWEVQ